MKIIIFTIFASISIAGCMPSVKYGNGNVDVSLGPLKVYEQRRAN